MGTVPARGEHRVKVGHVPPDHAERDDAVIRQGNAFNVAELTVCGRTEAMAVVYGVTAVELAILADSAVLHGKSLPKSSSRAEHHFADDDAMLDHDASPRPSNRLPWFSGTGGGLGTCSALARSAGSVVRHLASRQ